MRTSAWMLAGLLVACRPSPAPPPTEPEPVTIPSARSESASPVPSAPTADASDEIEATLRIDAQPGGKKFQGVWLEWDDGEKWVISYRADPLWRSFEGHRVRVRGAVYQPFGQAIRATHFRVETLALTPNEAKHSTDLVEVKAEKSYTGVFRHHVWPANAKLAGEKTMVFVSDGSEYFLANQVDGIVLDAKVEVLAREVVLSPFMARPGGPYLWILESRASR